MEHINDTESHDSRVCPGAPDCRINDNLKRILADLDAGRLQIVRVS